MLRWAITPSFSSIFWMFQTNFYSSYFSFFFLKNYLFVISEMLTLLGKIAHFRSGDEFEKPKSPEISCLFLKIRETKQNKLKWNKRGRENNSSCFSWDDQCQVPLLDRRLAIHFFNFHPSSILFFSVAHRLWAQILPWNIRRLHVQ